MVGDCKAHHCWQEGAHQEAGGAATSIWPKRSSLCTQRCLDIYWPKRSSLCIQRRLDMYISSPCRDLWRPAQLREWSMKLVFMMCAQLRMSAPNSCFPTDAPAFGWRKEAANEEDPNCLFPGFLGWGWGKAILTDSWHSKNTGYMNE